MKDDAKEPIKLATFKVDPQTHEKAQYVAWWEDRTSLTKFILEYFRKRIAKFEKEHGEITPAMIKEMKEKTR